MAQKRKRKTPEVIGYRRIQASGCSIGSSDFQVPVRCGKSDATIVSCGFYGVSRQASIDTDKISCRLRNKGKGRGYLGTVFYTSL